MNDVSRMSTQICVSLSKIKWIWISASFRCLIVLSTWLLLVSTSQLLPIKIESNVFSCSLCFSNFVNGGSRKLDRFSKINTGRSCRKFLLCSIHDFLRLDSPRFLTPMSEYRQVKMYSPYLPSIFGERLRALISRKRLRCILGGNRLILGKVCKLFRGKKLFVLAK